MKRIDNQAAGDVTWQDEDLVFVELIVQAYANCAFSAGAVEGHEKDSLYLKLERDGQTDLLLLVRPDEAAAIAWCMTGALWSYELAQQPGEVETSEGGDDAED
jgi:hypothetical protein